jgi:hypothetical protein
MSAVVTLVVLVIGFLLGAGSTGLMLLVAFALAAVAGVRTTGG